MPHQQEWLDKEGRVVEPYFVAVDGNGRPVTPRPVGHITATEIVERQRAARVQCNAIVDDSHKYTDVVSAGADASEYAVLTKSGREVLRFKFHEGPLAGASAGDVNGVMLENLLAIVIDRLEMHQRSKYHCPENQEALEACRNAVGFLKARTAAREARNVEGTHEL